MTGLSLLPLLLLTKFPLQLTLRLSFHVSFMTVMGESQDPVPDLKKESEKGSLGDQDQCDEENHDNDDISSRHTECRCRGNADSSSDHAASCPVAGTKSVIIRQCGASHVSFCEKLYKPA